MKIFLTPDIRGLEKYGNILKIDKDSVSIENPFVIGLVVENNNIRVVYGI